MKIHNFAAFRSVTRRSLLTLALGCLLASQMTPALAAPPNGAPPAKMTYQGFLTDGTNPLGASKPVNYNVKFAIHGSPKGDDLVWEEQQTVTVDNGQFSVLLGDGQAVTPGKHDLDVVFASATASDRFVEIQVQLAANGDFTKISPRLQLITSPYAFLARGANRLTDNNGVTYVQSDGAGKVTIAGELTATKLGGDGSKIVNVVPADNSVGAAKLASDAGSLAKVSGGILGNQGVHLTTKGGILVKQGLTVESGGIAFRNTDTPQNNTTYWQFNSKNSGGIDTAYIYSGSNQRDVMAIDGSGLRVNNLYASTGEENLRIIRGTINANGTIRSGSGFTVAKDGGQTGRYIVTFTTPFSNEATVTTSLIGKNINGNDKMMTVDGLGTDGSFKNGVYVATVDFVRDQFADIAFTFIAVGPR